MRWAEVLDQPHRILSGERLSLTPFFLIGEQQMTTDPKKNDEIKDEELEQVAGGASGDDADAGEGGGTPWPPNGLTFVTGTKRI